jgi:hypothetical protein
MTDDRDGAFIALLYPALVLFNELQETLASTAWK